MALLWTIQFRSAYLQPSICELKHRIGSDAMSWRTEIGLNCIQLYWNRERKVRRFMLRAFDNGMNSDEHIRPQDEVIKPELKTLEDSTGRFQAIVTSLTPVIFKINGASFAIGLFITVTFLVFSLKAYVARQSRYEYSGSVADLVKRGQLRSDRRGISRPLKYEDPFNNPLVKTGKSDSTIEMCGKVYRLAPVTLTEEQRAVHQKRRSRAYQWKRPKVFLKEGDSIPADVDPDTIRWIPANHPFATTATDIDEDLAQNNVYQKRGVPFRIQVEHEALQRKLEALQTEQKFSKLMIDPGSTHDFERPFKSQLKSQQQVDSPGSNQAGNSNPPISECAPDPVGGNISSEDTPES